MSDTVSVIIIGIAASALVMKAGDIGEFIMTMISDTTIERNQRIVNKIDCFLARNGCCSSHSFDSKKPADGLHFYNGTTFYRESVIMGCD
jgi:hypothetical protein